MFAIRETRFGTGYGCSRPSNGPRRRVELCAVALTPFVGMGAEDVGGGDEAVWEEPAGTPPSVG